MRIDNQEVRLKSIDTRLTLAGTGTLVFIAMVVLIVPSRLHGQSSSFASPATGIRSVRIVAEDADDEDRKCGLTKESEIAWAAKTLLDNRIKVQTNSDDFDTPYLYINIATIELPTVCVSSVDVSLRISMLGLHFPWTPANARGAESVAAVLKRAGAILSSIKSLHSGRLESQMKADVETIATFIRLANQ